ncbi:MAG: 7-cyano-7-deazaguanine synthase, partial [Candidatus Kapaibacterium sp.]
MESTNKSIAIVLLSGGMDSAVCAALAAEHGYELAALHLNYGQR